MNAERRMRSGLSAQWTVQVQGLKGHRRRSFKKASIFGLGPFFSGIDGIEEVASSWYPVRLARIHRLGYPWVMPESRLYNAEYYDAITTQTDDIAFYEEFVSPDSRVLELGCGTGRVSISLAKEANEVVGVDLSEEMLRRARLKGSEGRARFLLGDISSIQLDGKFDLIIAPFRVMQALETDRQVSGLFEVIRHHLGQGGTAILNVFNPILRKDEMPLKWIRQETLQSEVVLSDGDILKTSDTRLRLDAEKQVLHPELIHRRYRNGKLVDEHVNPICMRYYYPDEFKALILRNGFQITGAWGGYRGEEYGVGPELVVAFTQAEGVPSGMEM